MSSRLQLDVRNLSLGMRHLVNAYEVNTLTFLTSCQKYKNTDINRTAKFRFLSSMAHSMKQFAT